MSRLPACWWFGGVWDVATSRPGTVPTRQIRAAIKAVDFNSGVGRKPNMRLLFALARWGVTKERLPKKSLAKFIDDFNLFEVLRFNGQVPISSAFFLGDLSDAEMLRLEKRLHHQWPLVRQIVDALRAQQQPLISANAARRKYQRRPPKIVKSMVSTLLGV